MTRPRGLIVEDDPPWQEALQRALSGICVPPIDVAENTDRAWLFLNSRDYDLVTVDLSLVAKVGKDTITPNEKGFELLTRLRQSNREMPALVIVTGYPTIQRLRDAFVEYRVDDFVEKIPQGRSFDPAEFAARMRRVLLESRLRGATRRAAERHRATIVATPNRLIIGAIEGPGRRGMTLAHTDTRLDLRPFADEADAISVLAPAGGSEWRSATKAVGSRLYKSLLTRRASARFISSARESGGRRNPAVLEFAGPAELLRVPFELMSDGNDYVCFDSVVARRLVAEDGPDFDAPEFHDFISGLRSSDQPLNILLAGSDSDGEIPNTEKEIEEIADGIRDALGRVDLLHSIEILRGKDATLDAIRERLSTTTVHLFHYAGHGRFNDDAPEQSGVVVDSGDAARILSAAELKQLLSGSRAQLAFLSCCVGAQTAEQPGSGDFYGPLEAIARAGVPTVIGYRWIVPDEPARRFAVTFYAELFATFSPTIAMLRARQTAASDSPAGRNNPMWAAPIIISAT